MLLLVIYKQPSANARKMKPQTVCVNLGERSYDIVVTCGDLTGLGAFARGRSHATKVLIVTDANVEVHAKPVGELLSASGFQSFLEVLPSGEAQKSLAAASGLFDSLVEIHAGRDTLIVAVGGGVIGDLAGFVGATYARGLPLLIVPTTLLAMVDSSVGGKVGVNHPKAKNMIGAFHQPCGVWIDTAYLNTLPDREYKSGLAEVVKYGVIMDADLFIYLEVQAEAILRRESDVLQHIVARCCQLKAGIVEQDEREETGLRAVLNYGHTFAHAFEAVSGYGKWLHGEAVAAGMICASRLAERRGLVPPELTARQAGLLTKFGLPTDFRSLGNFESLGIDAILEAMRSDKKARSGQLRFVLPRRLGKVDLFDDVSEAEVRNVLSF
jgi:3-dehydroquinate synthase